MMMLFRKKVIIVLRKAERLVIEKICKVVLLNRSLRWITRRLLHSKRIPGWLNRVLTSMSSFIVVDDIEYFESQGHYAGSKITCLTKPTDHYVVASIYWRGFGCIDPETVAVFCERVRFADTILDIGANWGFYTLLAGSVAPNATVIAFEPHPFWFGQLKENMSANSFNVHVENLGVGETIGTAPFYLNNEHPSSSTMVRDFANTDNMTEISVPVTTIDSYVHRQVGSAEHRRIDLIKIDVETYEGHVLAGGKSVLREFQPDIICEILPEYNIQSRIANKKIIHDILAEFGYVAYWISDNGLMREDFIKGHSLPFPNYLFTTHRHRGKVRWQKELR